MKLRKMNKINKVNNDERDERVQDTNRNLFTCSLVLSSTNKKAVK
jgi:hypothetical protein